MTRSTSAVLTACLLAVSLLPLGCATWYATALPDIPDNEEVNKPGLLQFLKSNSTPSIVLRVPTHRGELTEAQIELEQKWTTYYNAIERELLKSGFTVRDRGLLMEVLKNNPKADYREIAKNIETELILDIAAPKVVDMSTSKYRKIEDGTVGDWGTPSLELDGIRLEARLILVESGEIGGIYVLHVYDKDALYRMSLDQRPFPVTKNKGHMEGTRHPISDGTANTVGRELVAILNKARNQK